MEVKHVSKKRLTTGMDELLHYVKRKMLAARCVLTGRMRRRAEELAERLKKRLKSLRTARHIITAT